MDGLHAAKCDGGIVDYEFAIPRASLEEVAGVGTKYVQVNAGVHDRDETDARLGLSLLGWRPYWGYSTDRTMLGVFELD